MNCLTKYEIIQRTNKLLLSHRYGTHNNQLHGSSNEFKDIVPYTTEQNIKDINWQSSAKLGKILVNRYHDVKEANIVLIYLCSGSMAYGSPKSKHDVAIEIMTALSHASSQKPDPLTTLIYSSVNRLHSSKMRNKKIVSINYDTVSTLVLKNAFIDYDELSEHINQVVGEESVIFIIGDFLQIPVLDKFTKKHAINCIVLRDKSEENMSLRGTHTIQDTNSKNSKIISISALNAKKYNKAMNMYDRKLTEYLSGNGVKHKKIYTDSDSILELSGLLKEQIW